MFILFVRICFCCYYYLFIIFRNKKTKRTFSNLKLTVLEYLFFWLKPFPFIFRYKNHYFLINFFSINYSTMATLENYSRPALARYLKSFLMQPANIVNICKYKLKWAMSSVHVFFLHKLPDGETKHKAIFKPWQRLLACRDPSRRFSTSPTAPHTTMFFTTHQSPPPTTHHSLPPHHSFPHPP